MNNTLVWLHLSDLHLTCKPNNTDNQDMMIHSLLRDIDKWIIQKEQKPDIIFITGDLAYAGKTEEYEEVEKFCLKLLEITGLTKNKLFIVPGNHDVDRTKIESFHIKRLYQFNSQNEISEVLSDQNIYSIFMRKLEGFYKFYNNFFDLTYKPEQRYIISKPDGTTLKINLVGLNSVLFAGYDGDDDQKLAFGLSQLEKAFGALDKYADLTIVFFHHPFSCFHDCEKPIQHRIKQQADLILTGHLHDSNNIIQCDLAAKVIIIGASSSYEAEKIENSFNLGMLDLKTGKGELQFYKYESGYWIKNTDINPYESEDGSLPFFILSFLRKKSQPENSENNMPPINNTKDELILLHLSDLHINNQDEAAA